MIVNPVSLSFNLFYLQRKKKLFISAYKEEPKPIYEP